MNTKQQPTQLIEIEPKSSALTPMSMLEKAITSGATVEVMERLMGLQERWEATQARKAFDNAMADAKAEIPVIIKNQSVGYENKNSSSKTSYMHEDMAQIARTIDPIIAKHGLSYRFRTTSEAARVIVTCVVSHRDGHSEENSLSSGHDGSGGKNAIQGLGSALTYLQRYSLKAAFGLAAAADDDGRTASEINQRPAERSRVPSPSDAKPEAKAAPEAPHAIAGGKGATGWAKMYVDAVLTSDSPDVVFKWVGANEHNLDKLEESAPELLADVRRAVEGHLNFLRKTDPISSGSQPKTAMPNHDENPAAWMVWVLDQIAKTAVGDSMDALFESVDPFWMDLNSDEKDALNGARRAREAEMEP